MNEKDNQKEMKVDTIVTRTDGLLTISGAMFVAATSGESIVRCTSRAIVTNARYE